MIIAILTILLLVIATEAITEIITSSTLVAPIQTKWRTWAYPLDQPPTGVFQRILVFIDKLWNCGYCASVWVAAIVAFVAPSLFNHRGINWVIMTFVLHRLANWLHVIYELIRRGRVNSLEVQLRIQEYENGTIGQSVSETATTLASEHSRPS